jgi:hypothetical protein
MVLESSEVSFAEPIEGRPGELRGPADDVVHLRLEAVSCVVVPDLGRDVAIVGEDRLRVPVGRLTGQEVTTLEDQDALAGRTKAVGQRATPGSGTDDDHVVVLGQG